MPRHHESISAVVALATKHGNRACLESCFPHELCKRICGQSPSRLHQLQTRNAKPLGGQAVNVPHLLGGKRLHSRLEEFEGYVAQGGGRGALGLFCNSPQLSNKLTASSRH